MGGLRVRNNFTFTPMFPIPCHGRPKRKHEMNERTLEIIVSRCPERVFGPGFSLVAHQLSLRGGRVDLLIAGQDGVRHVVEVKKSRAKHESIDQVFGYACELRDMSKGKPVYAWVVAHEIPSDVAEHARCRGVATRAVSIEECEQIVRECGLTAADLVGVRKTGKVINGGDTRHGLQQEVANEIAYIAMPKKMANALRVLERRPFFVLRSGGCQTTICYRGAKLGGVNRKGTQHGYIASGVIISSEQESRLRLLGFNSKTKKQAGSRHEHAWWQIGIAQVKAFIAAIEEARIQVDRALGVAVGDGGFDRPSGEM